jgi:ABC-type amino acid transport substrate-binding protein/signal transduction histidine kinase/CheY-like chemotaxis protein
MIPASPFDPMLEARRSFAESVMSGLKCRLFTFVLLFVGLFFRYGWCAEPLTVRVGAYENRPKIYTNAQGAVVGIFPDILDSVAYEEGWRLQYVFGTWSQCLNRLENNEIDIMVDVAFSEERNRRYDFSDESVFLNWGTVYTRHGFTIESLLDLRGKTVAVMRGSIHTDGRDGIKNLSSKFDLDLTFIEGDSYDDVFSLLDSAAADAGVVNRLYGALNEKKYTIQKSPLLLNPVQLKFATSKGNPYGRNLLERLDEHLRKMKIDPESVYHEIVGAYLNGFEFKRRFKGELRAVLLSSEEKAWIKAHPNVRIGVDPAYAPYSFRDRDGSYQGLAMDFAALISRNLGLQMTVVPGLNWSQILDAARNRSLDVVITAVKTPEREQYLQFSKIYIPTPLVIMAREDDQTIDGPEDMSGHKVALVKDYASAERVIAEHPSITAHMVDTPQEGLTAVSVGEAGLYVGVLGVNDFLSRKYGISNLKVAARYDMLFGGQRFAVRNDWPELVSILDKVLEAVSEKKRIAIFNTWISIKSALHGAAALQQRHCLTERETNWIQNHRMIRIGVDPEFAPFEFYSKDGSYSGIASEYVNILNYRLGLKMQVASNQTWKETMAAVTRQELDVLPCVAITRDRKAHLNFSDPYLNFHRIIINRTDTPFLTGLEDIAGMKVAVQANTSHSGYLKDHTDIQPMLYATLQEALRAVSDGEADALVGNIASATYWIRRMHLTNLKVAAPVSHELQKLHFAVREDWPELVSIINKGLASISLYKANKIQKHWIDVEYDPGIDPARFWKRILQVAGIALLILAAVAIWNFRLKKEIGIRRKVEKKLTYRLDFETLLLGMSSLFINLKTRQIREQISRALNKIAVFVKADAGFVFGFDKNGKKFFSSHGWFSDQLESKMDNFQELDASTVPWWVERLKRKEVIAVSSVKGLTDEALAEKELLLSAGINAIVSIPMSIGGEITGFLGVACIQDGRDWNTDEVNLLEAMGQIFTNALQRKRAEEALQRSHDDLEQRVLERTTDLGKAYESLQQEITDRKRMEVEKEQLTEQLIYAQKMEAIGTMAGGIAHDFNNILMPIIGYAEMTLLRLEQGSESWKNLNQIISASSRAKELIRQILTFSRQTDHDSKPISLEPLVKETLKLMRSSLPSTIEIRESIDSNAGEIMGNPTQIHQLLMNLCTNARHAMSDSGGLLTVSVDEIRYPDGTLSDDPQLEPGCYVRLMVSDTGQGIRDSIQARILEPYFTTKAADGGTGLGLSVAHGIVKKHGGHLTFSSEVGKGTTFQILFPKLSACATDKIKKPELSIKGGTEHIWVLDDDEEIALMVQKMLQYLGYTARAFFRSDQLIEEFRKNGNRVDLVITDMTMPALTGAELARQLLDLQADIPIILCTGFSESLDETTAKEIGIRKYLMKPVVMKELADTVRKVLDEEISRAAKGRV